MPVTEPLDAESGRSASERISARIVELADWRGNVLATVRRLIHEAAPDVTEAWKWRGTPVWSDHGILCTGESYQDKVKLTFAKGASLTDPTGIFNASLEGNVRRAIDLHADDTLDAAAFVALVREAAALNRSGKPSRSKKPAK